MKKTLAEILAENTDEIIRQATAINKLIENSKKAGVKWPEITSDVICPHCGEVIDDEDLQDMGDIGCPSCRKTFNVEDFICPHCDGTGCFLCRNTGEVNPFDLGYDELGAEADREEN